MKTKNIALLILCAALMLAVFAGCGAESKTVSAPSDPGEVSSVPPIKSANANDNAPAAAPDTPAEDENADPVKAAAEKCIGQDVEALYEAVGYPVSSEYASSCLGSGEDGELKYDGFTVYTYKEGSTETVQNVE